jgi:diacylglycerol O-acyltransferase
MNFEPLSGMDAGFLYMDTPTGHMHTLKVAVMSGPEERRAVGFERFRRTLESVLPRLPSFRQRIMEIPFGLGHPVWVEDEAFDVRRHLAYRIAPPPGDERELNRIVSEIASVPLPRDRPLWQITLVEGLERGRVAFVCKLHHSMADGAAAMAMLLDVLSQSNAAGEPDPRGAVVSRAPVSGESQRPPTRWEVTRWAIGQALRTTASLPQLLWLTLRGLLGLARRARTGPHPHLPAPFSGPRTRWNGALTARRSFATTRIPLAEMKRVKDALGVTVNDVMLGLCGGALRADLEEVEGAIPKTPLVASVPVNTRPELTGRTRGNHVGHLSVSLCTHIADPVERVRAIHEQTDEAKQRQMTVGPDLMERWIQFTSPKAHSAFVGFWSRRHIADLVPGPVNLVVSNVPGPRTDLVIFGHRLEAFYSVGPILEGIGLNITGWSYGDRVCFVGLACPDQIADVQALVDRIPQALAELVSACEAHARSPSHASARYRDRGGDCGRPDGATAALGPRADGEHAPGGGGGAAALDRAG